MASPLNPEVAVFGFRHATDPQISPDGSEIALILTSNDRSTGEGRAELWRCDIDGANLRQLSRDGVTVHGPAWSPDGSQITMSGSSDAGGTLIIMNRDGRGEREVTQNAGAPSGIEWSPDGRSIAYSATVDHHDPAVAARFGSLRPSMARRRYPSDLSDAEWARLEPLIPPAKPGGRPAAHPRRELVDAMSYVLRNGCSWRALPHDFPP